MPGQSVTLIYRAIRRDAALNSRARPELYGQKGYLFRGFENISVR